ncbi:hypothetical protein ACFLUC_01825 [Chloroflexota bacterium]
MSNPNGWAHTRGFNILGLNHGVGSNKRDLIFNPVHFERGEIYNQITNWEELEPIDYANGMDSYCHLLDDPNLPSGISLKNTELRIQGDLSRLERDVVDRRWNIFGNIGIWFRFALAIQERNGIFNLHASSIYKPDENELLVIAGKAGVGKTVFLLEALNCGYQIFSTEMTYFRFIPQGVVFYRGALYDNIRVGSFLYDFPGAAERLGLDLPVVENPWSHKINVSMNSATTENKTLTNPTLSFIFPRIEKGYQHANVEDIPNSRTLIRLLYDVASEKIGSTFLMYEELPAVGLDSPELAENRWEAIRQLVSASHWNIKQARTTLAGPKSCMEVIDE